MKTKIDKSQMKALIRRGIANALSDQDMATQLGVSVTTIWHWRNYFKISPADKFRRKFTEKYGVDALNRFQTMVEQGISLQQIGIHFGFSREHARRIHLKLYGHGVRDTR